MASPQRLCVVDAVDLDVHVAKACPHKGHGRQCAAGRTPGPQAVPATRQYGRLRDDAEADADEKGGPVDLSEFGQSNRGSGRVEGVKRGCEVRPDERHQVGVSLPMTCGGAGRRDAGIENFESAPAASAVATWGAAWLRARASVTEPRLAVPLLRLSDAVELIELHGLPTLCSQSRFAAAAAVDVPLQAVLGAMRAAAAGVAANPACAAPLVRSEGERYFLGYLLASERLSSELSAASADGRAALGQEGGWPQVRAAALALLRAVAEAGAVGSAALAADDAALLRHAMWELQLDGPTEGPLESRSDATMEALEHAAAVVHAAGADAVCAAAWHVWRVERCWRPEADGGELLSPRLSRLLRSLDPPCPAGDATTPTPAPGVHSTTAAADAEAAFEAAVRNLCDVCAALWHACSATAFPPRMRRVQPALQARQAARVHRANTRIKTLMAAFPDAFRGGAQAAALPAAPAAVAHAPARAPAPQVPTATPQIGRLRRLAARARAACSFGAVTGVSAVRQVRRANREVAAIVMSCPPAYVAEMARGGVFDATVRFSRAARANDPELTDRDEFQAGRNVWACLGLQLVVQRRRAACGDAVVGYSMLYPYTDNLLDEPSLGRAEKLEFQARFRRRLAATHTADDESWASTRPAARKAFAQVELVEREWERARNPRTFCSLLAIHDAQTRSLDVQCDPEKAAYGELLTVTVLKGGTSVLADAFMVSGDGCPRALAAFAFALGVGLQFVDDLQDVQDDCAAGQNTLFTGPFAAQGAGGYADSGVRRLCSFLDCTVLGGTPDVMPSAVTAGTRPGEPSDRSMRLWMLAMTWTMVLKAVARAPSVFSSSLRDEAAARSPLPWRYMPRIRGMRSLLRLVKHGHI